MDHNTESNVNLEKNDSIVNKRNSEEYKTLMKNAGNQREDYWDKNNPVVKIILVLLFLVIVVGVIYYFMLWFQSK